MLKKIIEKRNYIILFIITCLIIWIIWGMFFYKKEPYMKTFNYYGEKITLKVYENVDHKKLTKDINNIYKKYENINELSGEVSEEEKSLIEYGKILYYKTNGYIDVTDGKLIDSLKEDKEYTFKSDIDKIVVKDNKLVNDINFNFDSIIGSYATSEVIDYFKQNKIEKYIISENGDVKAGEYYGKGKYAVSINNPINDKVLDIVSLENKAMASRYSTQEFESYMVNSKTSKKESKYDGVIVIANDNLTANMLVNGLYLMDLEEGKKFVSDYNGEALWIMDGEIIKTDGFDNYVQK